MADGPRFGGRAVFAFGDRRAWCLPSSEGPPGPAGSQPPVAEIWQGFHIVELREVHHQNPSFGDALQRIAAGQPSQEDIEMCRSRHLSDFPAEEFQRFCNVPSVFLHGEEAKAANIERRFVRARSVDT